MWLNQVLPILEERLGHAEQCSMVWETLKEMPLRLLERVMPWLAGACFPLITHFTHALLDLGSFFLTHLDVGRWYRAS